ncbi:MAG TPA: hypothetical protein VEY92_08415 [Pseudoxanthomonas sp.]|nr:hypothetical protein [Pseudoxanthomonas sp.]
MTNDELDAKRYRWIRDGKFCPFAETDEAWDDLDTAIDHEIAFAAMTDAEQMEWTKARWFKNL